jgi:hypothetical protein
MPPLDEAIVKRRVANIFLFLFDAAMEGVALSTLPVLGETNLESAA